MDWKVNVIFGGGDFESTSAVINRPDKLVKLHYEEVLRIFMNHGISITKRGLYKLNESGKLKFVRESPRKAYWTEEDVRFYLKTYKTKKK